ncbi:MAG: hypothetical protein HDQ92_03265 [Desulfovibrio sp.]|nr:hypothetical protein [Desulfovibrio sp.]
MILSPARWYALAWQSRLAALIPLQLFQGLYLPVLTPFLSLLFWFASGLLFLALFPPAGAAARRSFFLSLLLFVLSPLLLGRIYYQGAGIGENAALCCFLLGTLYTVRKTRLLSFFAAVALFTFSLGVNPCILNTFWTLLLLLLLTSLITREDRHIFQYCCAFGVALLLYLVAVKLLIPARPFYNNQVAGAGAFLKNILPQLKASLAYFWQTQPPMNRLFKIVFSLICLGGFAALLARPKRGRRVRLLFSVSLPRDSVFLRLVLILLLVLTHNISAYVSGDAIANTFNLRMDYYSVPFLLSFCALAVLGSPGLTGRLFAAAAAVLVVLSMGADVRALQVWKISIDDDILYANRMLARIEASPGFDAARSWRILALGERPAIGERFWQGYQRRSLELQRAQHLGRNFAEVFNYIAPQLKISNFTGERPELCARHKAFLDAAPAWPSPGSLKVEGEEGLILVVLDRAAARRYCVR